MGLTEIKRIIRKAKEKIDKWFENIEDKDFREKVINDLTAFIDEKEIKNIQNYKFNLTFRLLRHTYCTGLYDAGIDEVSAAELMGHDINIMREVYTHISDGRRQKTIKKLGALYRESNIIELKESK